MSLPHSFFMGKGGGGFEWSALTTGDTYLGGTVLISNNKIMLQYYPTSRKTTGLTSYTSDLTGTFIVPDGVDNIGVWVVGGGAGGTGANFHAGGGGGGAAINGLQVTAGQSWTYQVGKGGRGGVDPNSTNNSWIGGTVSNFAQNGGTTFFSNSTLSFSVEAPGGTSGNSTTGNSSDTSDFGQGGTGTFTNLGNVSYASAYIGYGGRGGGREYAPTGAVVLGGGGGGGQPTVNWYSRAPGGDGAGRWGGGGGGGCAHDNSTSWLSTHYPGGSPGDSNYSYSGGYGGHTSSGGGYPNGRYGSDGGGPAGGRAYQQADGYTLSTGQLTNGSAGGGGFPGGGGGASVYSGDLPQTGYGGDGAAGILVIEWDL